MSDPNEEITVSGEFSVTFTRAEIEEAGGDYAKAVDYFDLDGHATYDLVTDDMDNYNLAQRDYQDR